MRRPGRAGDLRSRRPVQRLRLVCHRLRQEILVAGIDQQQRLRLERKERRQAEVRYHVKRYLEGKLVEGILLQRELVQGNSPQRLRQTQIKRLRDAEAAKNVLQLPCPLTPALLQLPLKMLLDHR